ncbi:hypothetical protein SAY86_012764 [Trapa natans]|uniref:Inhibitor I9 domain-containing protein n=1 Tax=Trapa natans TaxID=22666 RepID=A0AAN7MDG9_TRANT|nr:hypothetical protein SAY86_012764 [Trapa natans]
MGEAPSEATIRVIYTEKPPVNDVESHHIRTLAAILGSEEAARRSLIYVYKNAASGFSAMLTPQQVEELSKQPGVYQSVPQRKVQLHSERVRSTRGRKISKSRRKRRGYKGARAESFSLVFPPLVLVISIFFSSIAIAMAGAPSEATVHIIYTEKPPVDDVESHHIRTLAAVLGRSSRSSSSSYGIRCCSAERLILWIANYRRSISILHEVPFFCEIVYRSSQIVIEY